MWDAGMTAMSMFSRGKLLWSLLQKSMEAPVHYLATLWGVVVCKSSTSATVSFLYYQRLYEGRFCWPRAISMCFKGCVIRHSPDHCGIWKSWIKTSNAHLLSVGNVTFTLQFPVYYQQNDRDMIYTWRLRIWKQSIRGISINRSLLRLTFLITNCSCKRQLL